MGVRTWPKIASDEVFASVGFGEISWLGRRNSQPSDLTYEIRSNLAKADSENTFTSGSFDPKETLTHTSNR
jgi:hypothetical protein